MAILGVLWVHPTLAHVPVSSLTVGHPHGPSAPRPTEGSPPTPFTICLCNAYSVSSPRASASPFPQPHPNPKPGSLGFRHGLQLHCIQPQRPGVGQPCCLPALSPATPPHTPTPSRVRATGSGPGPGTLTLHGTRCAGRSRVSPLCSAWHSGWICTNSGCYHSHTLRDIAPSPVRDNALLRKRSRLTSPL